MDDDDPTHPIPDEEFCGKNLKDVPMMLVCAGYSVCEWTPEEDGKGKPEKICLILEIGADLDGLQVVMGINSRPEANRLIKMLEHHRDGVWPLPICARCGLHESVHGHGETKYAHPFEALA